MIPWTINSSAKDGTPLAGIKRLPVDQHDPQDRQRDEPKQAAPSGAKRDNPGGNNGGGHQQSSMHID
jgi:hypothetical protein